MEQQLEWYMRYAKTLSTLLGELETKVDGSVRSLQEEQARGREDITQLESELASSMRAAGSGAARTPRSVAPYPPTRPPRHGDSVIELIGSIH